VPTSAAKKPFKAGEALSYNETAAQAESLQAEALEVRRKLREAETRLEAAATAESQADELIATKDGQIATLQRQLQDVEAQREAHHAAQKSQLEQSAGEVEAAAEESQRALQAKAATLQGSLDEAVARNRLYEKKLLEVGIDPITLEPTAASAASQHQTAAATPLGSIDSNRHAHDFEEKLESLRSSLKDKKDLLHSRLNNARALTDKLKTTLEQPLAQ